MPSRLVRTDSPDLQLDDFSSILTDTQLDDYSSSPASMCQVWLVSTVLTRCTSTRAFRIHLIDLLNSTTCKHQSFWTNLNQSFLLLQSMTLTQCASTRAFRVQLIDLLNSMTCEHQSFLCPPDRSSQLNDAQAPELLE